MNRSNLTHLCNIRETKTDRVNLFDSSNINYKNRGTL